MGEGNMKFADIQPKLERIEEVYSFQFPAYYHLIDDEVIFSPKILSKMFNRAEGRIRQWFNPGLKHGKLPSIDPTRYLCTGKDLKEWLFQRDLANFMKDERFQMAVSVEF
jgi:hypothetical protein